MENVLLRGSVQHSDMPCVVTDSEILFVVTISLSTILKRLQLEQRIPAPWTDQYLILCTSSCVWTHTQV